MLQRIVTQAVYRAVMRTPAAPAAPFQGFRRRPGDDGSNYFDPRTYYMHNPPVSRFGGLFPFLGQLFKLIFMGGSLFALSVGSYAVFYHSIMPATIATEELFFDYSSGLHGSSSHGRGVDHQATSASSWSSPTSAEVATRRNMFHSGFFSSRNREPPETVPWAHVDLFARHTAWEAFEETVLPEPKCTERLLNPKGSYYFETILILPQSTYNFQSGMFGVVTELYSSNETQLAMSRRSVRMPHSSSWISTIRKCFLLIPLLIGALEETHTVTIPAFRHFIESPELPVQHVVVKVFTRPTSLSSPPSSSTTIPETSSKSTSFAPSVEIIRGAVRVGEELNPYQEFLKEWFYLCGTLGSLLFALFYMIQFYTLNAIWRVLYQRYFADEDDDLNGDIDDDPLYDFDFTDNTGFNPEHGQPPEAAQNGYNQAGDPPEPRRRGPTIVEIDEDDFDAGQWEDLNVNGSQRQEPDEASFATPQGVSPTATTNNE